MLRSAGREALPLFSIVKQLYFWKGRKLSMCGENTVVYNINRLTLRLFQVTLTGTACCDGVHRAEDSCVRSRPGQQWGHML